MIKYHIMALISLVLAAICAIEVLVRFFGRDKELSTPLGILMIVLFGGCLYLYFKIRGKRKKEVQGRN